MRKADETLEEWLRRGAGALRQQVEGLQVGLKKLGAGLEQLERERKPASRKPRKRAAVTREASRPRKRKKAA